MIKALTLSLLLLSGISQATCIGEAQISGKVKDVEKTLYYCTVFLTDDTQVRNSGVCPLDEVQMKNEGILVGLSGGHDCRYSVGDSIYGIVIDNGSSLYLE